MTTNTSGAQQTRLRMGLAFLVLGFVLLLFVWFSWLYRTSSPEGAPPVENKAQSPVFVPAQPGDDSESGQRVAFVQAAPMLLVVTFLLVLVFLVGSFILVRGIRRSLKAGDHQREPATPCDDVWSMQRVSHERDEHAA